MQPAVRWAAALLLLGVAVATATSHPTPSVMEIRHGWKPRAQKASIAAAASTAEQSYYEGEGYYEEKEVCLMENSVRDCGWQEFDLCNPNDDNDAGCSSPHYLYTSDVSCCMDNYDYGRHGHGSNSVGDHLWGPRSSIGSCDWTVNLITGFDGGTGTGSTGNEPDITDNIEKWGTASGICYFGADSQECGGPFCDRMVLTLEGAYYEVSMAYSYDAGGASPGADDDCNAEGNPGPLRVAQRTANGTRTARRTTRKGASAKPGSAKPAAAHTAADASTQYYDGGHDNAHTSTVYEGEALVINGVVTSMVGPKKDKWENGLFEYTIAFWQDDTTTSIDPNVPWVRARTYKFTFYKDHSY